MRLLLSSLVSLPPETQRRIVEARENEAQGGGSARERAIAIFVLVITVAMATLAGMALI